MRHMENQRLHTHTHAAPCCLPQTAKGWEQAVDAGEKLKAVLEAESKGRAYRLFFYTSPYLRCKQVRGQGGRYVAAAGAAGFRGCCGLASAVPLVPVLQSADH